MGDRLKDRVAVITGSGRGIGKAIAIAMAKEGAKVVVNDIDFDVGNAVAKEITDSGGQAVSFCADISKFDQAQKLIQTAVDNLGKLDILVNNGGTDAPRMVWNMTEEEWDTSLDSYLKGAFNCTRHACVLMRAQRSGRIVNATSIAWLGDTGHCNYCAAKAGLVGLTRAVAREMGRYGVTCNAYAPAAATRFTAAPEVMAGFKKSFEAGLTSKELYEQRINLPPPETVAPMVVYLCTEEAADITGQVFDIWGGDIAIYSEPVKIETISKQEGLWTVEELIAQVPKVLLKGYHPSSQLTI